MNGRLEIFKSWFCRNGCFFKFGDYIGKIYGMSCWRMMVRIMWQTIYPPMSSMAEGKFWGVASMMAQFWKVEGKIFEPSSIHDGRMLEHGKETSERSINDSRQLKKIKAEPQLFIKIRGRS